MSMLKHDAQASMLSQSEHRAQAYATYVRTYGLTQIHLPSSYLLRSVTRAGGLQDLPSLGPTQPTEAAAA